MEIKVFDEYGEHVFLSAHTIEVRCDGWEKDHVHVDYSCDMETYDDGGPALRRVPIGFNCRMSVDRRLTNEPTKAPVSSTPKRQLTRFQIVEVRECDIPVAIEMKIGGREYVAFLDPVQYAAFPGLRCGNYVESIAGAERELLADVIVGLDKE
jgi:hypothetical protein